MENSPLAVWIIVAEACEGERRTVVLTVLVRVYEDIVVFHVLNVISRGIFVEGVVEARELDALVLLVRKKKEGLVGCDFVNDPLDTLLVIPIPVVICAICL